MAFVIVAIVVILFFAAMYLRARLIVKRHAATLSGVTGIPAEQISREMIDGNQTPGEWAAGHGLDPMSFTPTARLKDRITATIAQEYPSETILAASEGQFEAGGGLIAVAATDQAVHSETLGQYIRNEYSSINKVEVEPGTEGRRGLFLSYGFDGEVAFSAYLVDADSVAAAIDGQLAKITLYTERVELTPDGGAMFRKRLMGDEYVWWIVYDPALVGPDDQPTAEASAATQEAIKRLNQYID